MLAQKCPCSIILIPNRDKGLREAIWLCTLVRRLTGWGCKRAKIMYYWRVQKHCRIFSGFHLKPKKTYGRLCTAGWRDKYYFLMKALICSFTEGWDYEVERNLFIVHLHYLTFTIQQHFTFWKVYEDLTALFFKNMSWNIFVASLYVKDKMFSCYELRQLTTFKSFFYSIL